MQDVETTMQALTSTLGRPLALELVGTTQSRRFIVRASTMSDAQQLVGQLRARYPQAEIRCIDPADDPLQVQAGETVSIVELGAGAASYLPLRTWKERDWEREGADPLLGQLAALAQVPKRCAPSPNSRWSPRLRIGRRRTSALRSSIPWSTSGRRNGRARRPIGKYDELWPGVARAGVDGSGGALVATPAASAALGAAGADNVAAKAISRN